MKKARIGNDLSIVEEERERDTQLDIKHMVLIKRGKTQ